jgi:16S rRNA (guanine(1405)-N(7))-methyltransferase
MPDLDSFYDRIFAVTGPPTRVADLACGLNPLTIPWMRLRAGATYLAADVDAEMTRFLNDFLPLAGVTGRAELNDLIAGPPAAPADVALLLKALPCLQHQASDLLRILDAIDAPWLVASFPTRSLGNRPKGMVANYRAFFADLVRPRDWKTQEILFDSELVFVVKK